MIKRYETYEATTIAESWKRYSEQERNFKDYGEAFKRFGKALIEWEGKRVDSRFFDSVNPPDRNQGEEHDEYIKRLKKDGAPLFEVKAIESYGTLNMNIYRLNSFEYPHTDAGHFALYGFKCKGKFNEGYETLLTVLTKNNDEIGKQMIIRGDVLTQKADAISTLKEKFEQLAKEYYNAQAMLEQAKENFSDAGIPYELYADVVRK